ncbi:Uncharacterised protein [Burkholderia pseudomallei]|nr:Uncharacterised protein [Burkholderia pseudomallei]CAJ8816776.1 Uncharacterised protein [Burkholderia pseudomallei]
MADQRERATHRQRACVRLAPERVCISLNRFEPQPREALALLGVAVAGRVVVVLERNAAETLLLDLRVAVQLLRRRVIVEIPQRDVVRLDPPRALQPLHPFAPLDRARLLAVRQILQRVVRQRQILEPLRVRDHHHMTIRLVLHPEVDPFVLQQPLHEVQIRFLKLHAVLARLVRTFELEPVAVALMALEHLLDDLRHAHVLEDPAVAVLREKRQPASQLQRVRVLPAHLPRVVAAEHVRVERPDVAFAQVDVGRQRRAEQRVEVQIRIVAQQIQLIRRLLRQALVHHEAQRHRIRVQQGTAQFDQTHDGSPVVPAFAEAVSSG